MAKQNIRASLVVYARLPDGWRRGSLVPTRTGFRTDAMLVSGVVHTVANPTYQVRTYNGSKAKYTTVGSDLKVALETLAKVQASRQLESAQQTLGIIVPKEEPKGKTLAELVKEYIAKKESPSLGLSETSIRHYKDSLLDFVAQSNREFPSEVTESDIISYCDHLKRDGYSAKTRKMRYTAVRGLLRNCGVVVEKIIDDSTHKRLSPNIEQDTEGYAQEDLDRLFAECDEYHALVYQFLLSTGMRYREASHLTWESIDFKQNIIHLAGEQRVNRRFRSRKAGKIVNAAIVSKTKNRKSREIPVFASLRPMLLKWRQQNPDKVFVFGTKNDMPDNHWLGYGKLAWKRAGLNCRRCDGCIKHNECEEFFLHRFRHSFAHRCLNNGVPIHKVSKIMGHHSVEVTMIYLSGDSTAITVDPFAAAKVMATAA
ncbi:MAG: site-specific integrase [Terracidiphilus sp.]